MADINGPIIFFGNERLATGVTTAAPTLQRLLEAGYPVAAVVSHHSDAGVSRKARTLEIEAVAQAHNIPVLLPDKPADIIEQLKALKPAVGVLVAYGKIVPQSLIDIFPAGIVNIHPSLLPRHRGPTPLESVMLDGGTITGVSLMQLVRAMDAGPVYAYSEYELSGAETKQELADDLSSLGASMLVTLLSRIIDGSVTGKPQDDAGATYDKLITKEDGVIDWHKPAARLEREIRAYADWPKSRTILGDHAVIVTKAHVANGDERKQIKDKRNNNETGNRTSTIDNRTPGDVIIIDKTLTIQTGDGRLIIDELKPAGKAAMTATAFLNGYGKNL